MTDTGRVPGEGQSGYADTQPVAQHPHPPAGAHAAYAYPDLEAEHPVTGDDEDLLMPGAQSAWSEGQSASGQYAVRSARQQPAHAGQSAAAQSAMPRRPLHLGPPVPEQSGAVRTLADRGPRTPPPAQAAAPVPLPQDAPEPAPASGPEYFDVPHQQGSGDLPVPNLGVLPEQPEIQAVASASQPSAAEAADPSAGEPLPGPDPAAGPYQAAHPAAPETADPDTTAPVSQPDAEQDAEQDVPPAEAAHAPGPQPPSGLPVASEPVPPGSVAPESAAPESVQPTGTPQEAAVEDGTATAQGAPVEQPEPGTEADTPPAATEPVEPVGAVPVPPAEAAPATPPAPHPHGPEQTGTPAPEPVTDGVPGQAAEAAPTAGEDPADPAPPAADVPQVPVAEAEPIPPGPADGTDVPVAASDTEAPADPAPSPAPTEAAPDVVPGPPDAAATGPEQEAALPAPAGQQVPQTVDAAECPAASSEATAEPPAPDGASTQSAAPADPPPAEPDPALPGQTAPSISGGTAPEERPEPSGDGTAADATAAPAPEPVPTAPAPGYDDAERETVHRLMRDRRDIRNGFRPDPIPHDVLLRVLEAAHTAPSVGHSQPWDFVVIRSEATRRTMHELATRQREAYAKSLPKARAKQFKELKVEAILDTPVNIVVTADPTRGGRHTLGRHTQPQMAPYSSALAVENLWLAARAEGLGVGWVSFFDEREMVRALDLPEHLEVVAYLCIGYVDEFPAEPELVRAGWSKRRPLSWVVHEESYGRRVLPGAEPHDLLAETLERIRPLDAKALGEAWERQKRMTKPAGALGMLEIISAQLCGLSRQCPPPIPEPAAVAVFAGDHGVHAQGVTLWPQEVTAQMVANFLGGGAVCNAFANQVGAEVCVVDVGVSAELPATPGLLPRKIRSGTADMTQGPALTQEEVLRAIEVGIETARDLVTAGNRALVTGEMGIANTTASAALIAACTGSDPAEVTGRGTGIDDETHAHKIDVVRRALQLHQPDPADPIGLLAAIGGLEHAALTGLVLGGASLRTPVILDGVSAGAAALVARQIAPEALAACIAGHRSAEPGHVAALTKLGLRPLIDLDLRLGEGTGALLALPVVQSAARAMHEVATFDSAGVTEKN